MDQQAPLQGHALGMARLYGLSGEPEHPAQVPRGHLPKRTRKDAPAWEKAARKRMHNLLKPENVVSEAEGMVLADAQIPLKPRPNRAGYHIDRAVARHSEDTRAAAHVSNATGIARLYGLTREPEYPAQAPLGHLPMRRKDAPAWEKAAQQRMHDLLDPARVASEAERMVLADAQIPLKPRPQGAGYHIDPAVARHGDDTRAAAHVSHATGIARLYGLTREPEHPAQVPRGHLPKRTRKDAPAWEKAARKRMHNLLDPAKVVSEAEGKVLADAQIPLKPRPQGGYHIDPGVPRHSDDTRAAAHVSNATGIARLYGLTREPEHPAQVPLGHLPTTARKDAPEWEKAARQRMHHLLDPARVVSEAEGKVLADAQIPLKPRPNRAGYYIDPAVPRQRDFLSGVVAGGVQPGLGLPGAGAAQSWSGAAVPLPGVLPASDEAQNPVGRYLVSAAGSGQFSSPQAGHQPGPSQAAPLAFGYPTAPQPAKRQRR
ncbi:hypothetical protein OIE75_33415 [Streptomyces sp. NBC_01723]|uniref:hypothetical protein n=1 Tax=Streptomyces sp. NBC_01723 TaxID=2975921 RepID=UPI002E31ECE8|nr:hypothetical protein [Streptomyces sp. NBC_01723]